MYARSRAASLRMRCRSLADMTLSWALALSNALRHFSPLSRASAGAAGPRRTTRVRLGPPSAEDMRLLRRSAQDAGAAPRPRLLKALPSLLELAAACGDVMLMGLSVRTIIRAMFDTD